MKYEIKDLIPHRDRMLLLDSIIEVGANEAKAFSIVKDSWPLFNGSSVDPVILIELVAQTAGLSAGWKIKQNTENAEGAQGWIVGIKNVSFYVDAIPENSEIITYAKRGFNFDNFIVFEGHAIMQDVKLCDISLQVFHTDAE